MRFESFLLLVLTVGLSACGKSREPGHAASQSPLIGSESVGTLTALHDTVEARALRGDTLGLLRLLVGDSVYRERVWPTTPSYDPDREEVWNLVMSMHKANSNKGLRRMLHDIRQPEAGSVLRPPLGVEAAPGGTLHHVSKTDRMRTGILLFGSALCLDAAGCQVLSYSQGGAKSGGGENGPETENP